jgi:predicted ribosome quality control (RQC) complex YloA/Tae2 family protein
MYKNYFILNRIVLELNSVLKNSVISEIYSQEKDKLVLKCVNGTEKFIEISVNPGDPYITLKDDLHRAKKNSLDFFLEYLPIVIKRFEISDHDRLLKISGEKINFYFAIRGKYTNVFVQEPDGDIISFKSENDSYLEEFREEIKTHSFLSGQNKIDFSGTDRDFEDYRKKYPFLGKEIITEAKYRFEENAGHGRSDYLAEITGELLNNNPAVFLSRKIGDVHLAVDTFHIFPAGEIKKFESITEALNYFLGKKYYLEAFASKRKTTEKHIERELSKLSSKLNDLKGRIDRGSREDEYNKIGNLLLINLNKIPPKSSSADIEDIYADNKRIIVKLDPKLSPQKNAEYYFNKAGNEKTAYKKSRELFKNISENYSRLKQIKEKFQDTESLEELNKIMKELKIKSGEKKELTDDIKSKFKHYIIDTRYDVFVGKDSTNNDLLTMKFAKQNDYWFHARSVPGSHVVLKVVNTKEPVPKNILKNAAAIAAYHSKAKTSGLAPVSYTFKKYVTKKKGMEPGKVALLKEEVLLVKPEIPKNCEYITED